MVMTFLYQLIWIFNKDIITSKLAIIIMLDFEYWRSFYSSQYMYLVDFFFKFKKKIEWRSKYSPIRSSSF